MRTGDNVLALFHVSALQAQVGWGCNQTGDEKLGSEQLHFFQHSV